MEVTTIDIFFISVLIILGLVWFKTIGTINKMDKTESILKTEKVTPECSDVSHGMVLTTNGLEGDEKPTLSWISRLAG